ncbi:MAG TPA: 23S rRNA (guanosine(2251)-2'-O)-methyltransferase RlmB [Gammaproteobacteria bacterium]|nr:23S rRNA (guanosine(2251)-2'-O)-methyltransferase RlmB [Gammaproteobacteria bacterium]
MNDKSLLFGLHAVQSLLSTHPSRIVRLIALKERHDKRMQSLLDLARENNISIELAPRHELDRLSHHENHQGLIAFCVPSKRYSENDLDKILDQVSGPVLLLILDGVQDPHNLGACLRSADAAGVHAVIAPKDKSAGMTPTVAKVASGAADTVPFIQVTNLARTLRELAERNIWIYGAAADAEKSLYQADLTGPTALVLGAEGSGLRRLTREHCDNLLNIPMKGSVSSLNVSVAAGVFLFEAVRQRILIIS